MDDEMKNCNLNLRCSIWCLLDFMSTRLEKLMLSPPHNPNLIKFQITPATKNFIFACLLPENVGNFPKSVAQQKCQWHHLLVAKAFAYLYLHGIASFSFSLLVVMLLFLSVSVAAKHKMTKWRFMRFILSVHSPGISLKKMTAKEIVKHIKYITPNE